MPAVVNLKFPPDDLTRGDAVYSRMHTPVRARRRPRRRKRVQCTDCLWAWSRGIQIGMPPRKRRAPQVSAVWF